MWMASGVQKLQWDQTAQILTVLYNANIGADAEPSNPWDFHPFRDQEYYQQHEKPVRDHMEKVMLLPPAMREKMYQNRTAKK